MKNILLFAVVGLCGCSGMPVLQLKMTDTSKLYVICERYERASDDKVNPLITDNMSPSEKDLRASMFATREHYHCDGNKHLVAFEKNF